MFFPLHERALFIVHLLRGQGVSKGGGVHTHLESIPTFYPELIWLHLTSSNCQIDILIPHSHNCFLFSASTGLALWRTRTTATSRASPTLSAKTTSGCFQSLVRCIFVCDVEHELWMDACFTLWCLCPNWCSIEILDLAIIWSFGFPFYPSSRFTDNPLRGKWL